MATESNTREVQKSQSIEELSLLNDDIEAFDDNNDATSDENNGDDYLDGLEDFELKDMDTDFLSLLNSGLHKDRMDSVLPNATEVTDPDTNSLMNVLSTGLEVPNAEEEDVIDSEEEKTFLKEIRDEIESKIREEMKDELKEYHKSIQEIETCDVPSRTYFGKTEVESLEDMDPKLREAIIKMKKLDQILVKKMKIEKEVKRNRILLEKRMRQEIAAITKGVNIQQDIKINIEKFLALEPPDSHNEGITLDDGEDLPPLFQTQISESEALWRNNKTVSDGAEVESEANGTNRDESLLKKNSRSFSSQTNLQNKGKKQKKDFIMRNKELAANADQYVAMTDDEKTRLAELLEGVDELSGPEEEVGEDSVNQLILCPGEGFSPDQAELKSLNSINEQLKTLMPADDYFSFVQPIDASPRPVPEQLFSRAGMQMQSIGADLPERYGERVLYEAKDERELKTRLQAIEQELDKFRARNEEESTEECHLTDEQLDSLLDQCVRNITVTACSESPDLSARSVTSSRLSLMENPPKLTEEQLQKLLSEAHFPMSSRLLFLEEDDDKILQDKGSTETIRAETWKAIKDVDIDEQCVSSLDSPSQIITDDDLWSNEDIAEDVNLNVSNNHNKNVSIKNNETNTHNHSSGSQHGSSSPQYSAFDMVPTSVYSGSVTNGLHATSGGLPRIAQSNGVSRSESYLENRISAGTPILLPRDNMDDMVRLPNICAKSFLVHTQQGMNNTKEKDRSGVSTKQPLEVICNDLSDMKVESVSNDKDGARGQGYGSQSSSRTTLSTQPRPPLSKDWQ